MTFKFVEQELNSLELSLIPLNALHPDDRTYSVLLNQIKGELAFSPDAIGNSAATRGLAKLKFDNFLEVAVHGQYDLVACPEYSCPWGSIETSIQRNQFPEPGKVWILGAEGITPKDLTAFIQRHTNITWIYDADLVSKVTNKVLFDPACIFFKAKNQHNETKNVGVVQFKNKHMSVQGDGLREVDVLIEGRYQYVIQNPGATVSLLTMICSDSLSYVHQDVLKARLETLLLVHIQMNPDPRHHVFKQYRDDMFTGQSVAMEIMCLNWAKGSTVAGTRIEFSGTGYFTKTDHAVLRDDRINDNQKHSLYYTYWPQKRSHLYFYPSNENIFCFETHKASQTLAGGPPHRRRDGAVGLPGYAWNAAESRYDIVTEIDKSFATYCADFKSDLAALDKLSYVDKERLVKLSSASTLGKNCFDIPGCDYFMIDDVEIIKRLTYIDEINPTVNEGKRNSILSLKELIKYFKNSANFPSHLIALAQNTTLMYSKLGHPFFNVYDSAQKPVGTVIYLGASVPGQAESAYNFVHGLILGAKPELEGKPLILVWYTDDGLQHYSVSDHKIDADINENQLSITKEET